LSAFTTGGGGGGGILEDAAEALPGTGRVDESAASGDCTLELCELLKGHQPMIAIDRKAVAN